MADPARELITRLAEGHPLAPSEFETILTQADDAVHEEARALANELRQKQFGQRIFIRGLVEFTSFCKNDCLYCGLRRSNANAVRYRLTPEQILECAHQGYAAGFRTLVLQGGEDAFFTDERMCGIVAAVKSAHPDMAVTLSLGERSFESYRRLREAGADRYLLRHETALEWHYAKLHPAEQQLSTRLECLHHLKQLGFQVGCGMMVGSPCQTPACLAADLSFIQEFKPHMVGLGPFIPHKATPFANEPAGSVKTTLLLLALVRLMLPKVLLPATTALATLHPEGRLLGIQSGANVIMPNLSPIDHRDHYSLYDNKANTGAEAAEGLALLSRDLAKIGCEIAIDRGDAPTGVRGQSPRRS